MKKVRVYRIFVFSAVVVGLLFSGICVADFQASPLFSDGIELEKTGSPTEFSRAGEIINYTYVVKNTSGDELLNVEVTDDLVDVSCPNPSSLNRVTSDECFKPKVYSGEMTCTGTYTITEEDVAAGEVVNKATVSASGTSYTSCCKCGPAFNIEASDSFTVTYKPPQEPELSLTKTGSPDVFMAAGEEITYTYLIENTGNGAAEGPVTVSDDLVDVTCPGGDLAPGAHITCTGTYTIQEGDIAAGSVTNNATAFAGDVSAEDSFTVTLDADPALSLVKTASPTVFSTPGGLVQFTFELTNTGDVPLSSPFTVDDSLDLSDFSCASATQLPPGESLTCSGWYTAVSGDVGQTIENCATATGKFYGGDVTSQESCVPVFYQAPKEKEGEEPGSQNPCEPWPECSDV